MSVPSVTILANPIVYGASSIVHAALANPKVSALALGILTMDRWMPKAEAGILAYMACYSTCMATSASLTAGGFIPAMAIFCHNLCAPLLAAPTP
jgi:hypothetical protein